MTCGRIVYEGELITNPGKFVFIINVASAYVFSYSYSICVQTEVIHFHPLQKYSLPPTYIYLVHTIVSTFAIVHS